MPIGGLKEKLLAAHRSGIATVVIPEENRKDLIEIPDNILSKLDVRPVRWIDQVLEVALQVRPAPKSPDPAPAEAVVAAAETTGKGGGGLEGVRAH